MKKLWLVVMTVLLGASCSDHTHEPAAEAEEVTIAVTRWTERTELFMEYPPLVAGHVARFAVHLTDLRDFQALRQGRVTVELRPASGSPRTFRADAPSRPGIFGVNVQPAAAGSYNMSITLESAQLRDVHDLGPVQVYPDEATAAKAAPAEEEGEGISFLKEQQWTLDFGTAPVAERALRESLNVTGEVRPRAGGDAEVTAPVAGRLAAASAAILAGTTVQRGQVLGRIVPRTPVPADGASLELEVQQASTALRLATRDRERAERLVTGGAAPAKRLEEARGAEATAQSRMQAAEARLKQHDISRDAGGEGAADSQFVLRAPIGGVVAAARATPGASVEGGESLFRIVATDPVLVVANVPEADAWRVRRLAGGELEVSGESKPLPLGRVVSVGRVVDSASRTLPVTFEVSNAGGRLAVGQTVAVRLFTSNGTRAPAVPESAVIDDAGRPVVFVQVSGESFARRPVKLGSREGGYVQILEGAKPGERVVTTGAYQVRLAALSTQIPAHGHVH